MRMIGSDLLLFALSAAMIAWLRNLGGTGEQSKSLSDAVLPPSLENAAFVFIKPHANTLATQILVREKLIASGINIVSEMEIDGTAIDKKKLIDQHYYAIASKATIQPAKDIPVPHDKFEEAFGESWKTVLREDRACNAMEACQRWDCNAQDLDEAWRQAENAGLVVKFGGGFYCGLLSMKGKKLYVFNAFFMSMRSKFVGEGKSIHCYEVQWDPKRLSWASFRGQVLGPTDPAQAPKGSLRKTIFDQYKKLGLDHAPNKGDNGVHASASPFEGLAEKINWLNKQVEDDAFGRAILASGIPKKTVKAWSLDPRIPQPDGSRGSVFDALEDLDADDCLQKMKQLHESSS